MARAFAPWHITPMARLGFHRRYSCQRDGYGVCADYPRPKELYGLLRWNTNGMVAVGAILFAGYPRLGCLAVGCVRAVLAILLVALAQISFATSIFRPALRARMVATPSTMVIPIHLANSRCGRLCIGDIGHPAGCLDRQYTHQAHGRTHDSIFHIGKLHSYLSKDRCLGVVGIVCFIGHRIVYLDRQYLFNIPLLGLLDNQRRCWYCMDQTPKIHQIAASLSISLWRRLLFRASRLTHRL